MSKLVVDVLLPQNPSGSIDFQGDYPPTFNGVPLGTGSSGGSGGFGASVPSYATFITSGSSTFVLPGQPVSIAAVDVSLNGLTLIPGADFNIAGSNLTLLFTPPAGMELFVRWGQGAISSTTQGAVDTFVGNGTTSTFTLSKMPSNLYSIFVSIDGLLLVPGADFTWNNNSFVIMLSSPPASGAKITVQYILGILPTNLFSDWYVEVFSGNGVQQSWPLSRDPGGVENVSVVVNGIVVVPGIGFSITNQVLTFTAPPASGSSNIFVRYGTAIPISTIAANRVKVVDQKGFFSSKDLEFASAAVGAASIGKQTLTATVGGTLTPEASNGSKVFVSMPAGNFNVGNPSVVAEGLVLEFVFKQDPIGNRSITWGSSFKKSADGTGPGNSKGSTRFLCDGTHWIQQGGPLIFHP